MSRLANPYNRKPKIPCIHHRYCRFYHPHGYACSDGPNTETVPACFRCTNEKEVVWLYIIECEGNVLYTGITNNPRKRFGQHLNGGSWLTKRLKAKKLRCLRIVGDRGMALEEEEYVTKLNHRGKIAYIKKFGIQKTLLMRS